MKNRILSALLALCMIFTMLPATAFAACILTIIYVNIEEPEAGQKPDYDAYTGSSPTASPSSVVDSVTWNGTLDGNGCFIDGETYTVEVVIKGIDNTKYFGESLKGNSKQNATINGTPCTVASWAEQKLLLAQTYEVGVGPIDNSDYTPPQPTTPSAPSTSLTVPPDLGSTSSTEWDVLRLTNIERAKEGLPLLVTFDTMQELAAIRSDDLVIDYRSDHTRPDGSSCFTVFGLKNFHYSSAAENIASGFPKAKDVVEAWMASPGHRANILTSGLRFMGTGEASRYWVQLFASNAGSDCERITYNEQAAYFTLELKNGTTAYAPYDPISSPIVDGNVTFNYPGNTTIREAEVPPTPTPTPTPEPTTPTQAAPYFTDAWFKIITNENTALSGSGSSVTASYNNETLFRAQHLSNRQYYLIAEDGNYLVPSMNLNDAVNSGMRNVNVALSSTPYVWDVSRSTSLTGDLVFYFSPTFLESTGCVDRYYLRACPSENGSVAFLDYVASSTLLSAHSRFHVEYVKALEINDSGDFTPLVADGWYTLSLLGVPISFSSGTMVLQAGANVPLYLKNYSETQCSLMLEDGRYLGVTEIAGGGQGYLVEDAFRWTLTARGDGSVFTLHPAASTGYMLNPQNGNTADGTNVDLWVSYGSSYDFTFTPAQGSTPSTGSVSTFTDVPTGCYYEDAVAWAKDANVTTGTTATTFSPDKTLTRAEVVTFLKRAIGTDLAPDAGSPLADMWADAPESKIDNPFIDVPAGIYYEDAVLWAVDREITTGTSTGATPTFSPNDTCTHGQVLTFLYRALAPSFSDPVRSEYEGLYYGEAATWALNVGLIHPDMGSFNPNAQVNRADTIYYIYKAVDHSKLDH